MATTKRTSELTAGLFVLAGLATILGIILWLGASELFRKARQRAYFYVDESAGASGLGVGIEVFVGSTRAGKITGARFDAKTGQTIYAVDIERDDVTIYSDAQASAEAGLLGGGILVVTSRGSKDKPLADEAHPAPVIVGGIQGTMNQLAGKLREEMDTSREESLLAGAHAIVGSLRSASERIRQITVAIQDEIDAQKTESLLGKIRRSATDVNAVTAALRTQADVNAADSMLAKAHKTMDDINEVSEEVKPRIRKTMANIEATTDRLKEYVEFDIAAILIDLRQTSTNILQLSRDFAELSQQAKEIIVLNRDNIDEMIDNMAAVSADLKAAAKEIRRNPWRLVYKPKKDEIHSQNISEAARAFSNGAEQLDQALAKLKAVDPKSVAPEQIKKIQDHLRRTFENFSKAEQALWKEFTKGS